MLMLWSMYLKGDCLFPHCLQYSNQKVQLPADIIILGPKCTSPRHPPQRGEITLVHSVIMCSILVSYQIETQ